MSKYVPLNPEKFATKGWRKVPSYAFSAKHSFVPVQLEELPHVLPTTPLAFVQLPQQESSQPKYELVAVLSPSPQLNLYVAPDGRWLGGYVPAAFRGYPFRLFEVSGEKSGHILCFDEESGLLSDAVTADSQPFYVNGELAPIVNNVLKFLALQEQGRAVVQRAVGLLNEHGLIEPWVFNIKVSGGDPLPVKGFFRINEKALKALDGSALKALQDGNALSVAYAQLYSQHRLSSFDRLYEVRQKMLENQRSREKEKEEKPSIDSLFGDSASDVIRFNS